MDKALNILQVPKSIPITSETGTALIICIAFATVDLDSKEISKFLDFTESTKDGKYAAQYFPALKSEACSRPN